MNNPARTLSTLIAALAGSAGPALAARDDGSRSAFKTVKDGPIGAARMARADAKRAMRAAKRAGQAVQP